MSFDVFLQFAESDRQHDPALETKVTAVARKFGGDRQPGGYGVELADGAFVDIFMREGADSAMIALRDMSPTMASFLFDVMQTTGWALIFGGAPPCALMLHKVPTASMHDGFPSIQIVKTPEELAGALSSSFGNWADYRNQVVGQYE